MSSSRGESSRYYPIVAVIIVLMAILVVRLFFVTVVEHKFWKEEATKQNSKEIYIPAPRGNIYDRNGAVLATNKQVFTASFNSNGMTTEEINQNALNLINLLLENEDKYNDKFPIKISKSGNFYYTYDYEKEKWLGKNSFASNTEAEDVFNVLRIRYEIDNNLDRYEAVEEIYKKYGISIPINVKNMTYTFDADKKNFIEKFHLGEEKNKSASNIFKNLRKMYELDESLSDEEARKIFIVRNELANNGFSRYIPVTIGTELTQKTVSFLSEAKLKGIEINSETIRYYPNGSLAASILGYMGSISEDELQSYIKKGYSSTDLVGKAGIESVYEDKLRGKKGVKRIRVNARGEYIDTISETKPKSGSDVYLTIDIKLQKAAEKSLAENIKKTAAENPECKSGSTVALDVKTGDALALANLPSYDPNIFASGISEEAWESVQSSNPRDPLAPAPLYNIATRVSVQPGSIFKPITCIAAQQCGLDPNMTFPDNGVVKLGDRNFACYAWNNHLPLHGNLNMEHALGTSCNYYFYCIATGKNWTTKQSFGYKKEMSIDRIMNVGKSFGLGEKTGIELGEVVSPIPTEKSHKENIRISLWNTIYTSAHTYFPEKVVNDEKRLYKNIDTIAAYMDKNPDRYELFKLIEKNTDVKSNKIEELGDLCKYSFFNRANWGVGDIFNVSIGQGDNAYTPVQMASYAATLGNNGVRNQVSIVKGISGYGATKKSAPKSIPEDDKEFIQPVIKGMERVVQDSGLTGIFKVLPVNVATKTGTAERSGKINPADEVGYIKEHLAEIAPNLTWEDVEKEIKNLQKNKKYKYASQNDLVDRALIKISNYKVSQSDIDKWKSEYASFAWNITLAPSEAPKIAVSSLLIQGGTSSNAVPVTRDVIAAYYEKDTESSSVPGHVTVIGENRAY